MPYQKKDTRELLKTHVVRQPRFWYYMTTNMKYTDLIYKLSIYAVSEMLSYYGRSNIPSTHLHKYIKNGKIKSRNQCSLDRSQAYHIVESSWNALKEVYPYLENDNHTYFKLDTPSENITFTQNYSAKL